jgi:hypothetical protein
VDNDDTIGTKTIMKLKDGFYIVQLLTPEALDYESCNMGHCVGQGSYDTAIASGDTIIYSLRDKNNKPHATLEVKDNIVKQIKGHNNEPIIEKYRPYIIEFINASNFKDVKDIKNIGLIKLDGKLYTLEQLYQMKDIVVKGDVDLSYMNLTKLPHFKSVGGFFSCSHNQLTSLQYCPQEVGGGFYCSNNQLTSLEYCPQKVGGDFWCDNNQLKLERPKDVIIGGKFYN